MTTHAPRSPTLSLQRLNVHITVITMPTDPSRPCPYHPPAHALVQDARQRCALPSLLVLYALKQFEEKDNCWRCYLHQSLHGRRKG